jgi:hypothetical protein
MKPMRHKIQVTVDDDLHDIIKTRAKQMSLSISSYARLALISAIPQKKMGLLDQGLEAIRMNNVETLTLAEFNKQIDDLKDVDSKK